MELLPIKQNEHWELVAEQAWQATLMRKHFQKIEEQLLEQLKTLSNNNQACGVKYRLTYTERKGSIDYARIPQLKKVDLEKYRKPAIRSWKLTNNNFQILQEGNSLLITL